MSHAPHIIYLQGIGSGPASQKGLLIREHFSARGFKVSLPSVTVPSLEQLSPRAAVGRVRDLIRQGAHGDLILMGSSFGAFLSVHAYHGLSEDERAHVKALILLAPALNPWDPSSGLLTPDREQIWRERGSAPVLDLESGVEVPVHYRFVEELREFDSSAVRLDIPTLIVHGIDDEVVPSAQSRDFAESRPSVSLVLVQDTHQLLNEAPKMLSVIERFILSGSTDSR